MDGSLTQESLSTRRLITVNDIPWILSLAHERYRPFDPGRALSWIVDAINNPRSCCIRSDDAFCFAGLGGYFWFPKEPECFVVLLCAAEGKHWQAVRLLRETIEWAREQGCTKWWLSSDTDYEFRALAKRVGAVERPRFLLDLSNGQQQ